MRVGTESARVLLGMPVCLIIYGHAVEQEGYKVVVWFPVLKREFLKNRIYLSFDSRDNGIVFIIVFETNNTSNNSSENIHMEYI